MLRPASRTIASRLELGYWSWLRVVLVVAAVAHRQARLSSAARISTVERALNIPI
jgi:hypothetical protein